jgi:demethylmenaquinone methyltransferase/2-methoxy-6-polyprenyl-1,4-benzoquinol methylase
MNTQTDINTAGGRKVVLPFGNKTASKKVQVTQMFDAISKRYDLLNRVLSLGIDVGWRKKAVRALADLKPQMVVDIATGTGDFAILAAQLLQPQQIIGIDVSPGMLSVGKEKIARRKLHNIIDMQLGDSEALTLADNSVDAITVGFGVRNFENLEKGLSEIYRVLRPGGRAAILEPAVPRRFPIRQLFLFYFRYILPLIGRLISRNKVAYTYLPESVRAFPDGEEFLAICRPIGFSKVQWKPLTLGICSFYLLEK